MGSFFAEITRSNVSQSAVVLIEANERVADEPSIESIGTNDPDTRPLSAGGMELVTALDNLQGEQLSVPDDVEPLDLSVTVSGVQNQEGHPRNLAFAHPLRIGVASRRLNQIRHPAAVHIFKQQFGAGFDRLEPQLFSSSSPPGAEEADDRLQNPAHSSTADVALGLAGAAETSLSPADPQSDEVKSLIHCIDDIMSEF